MKLETQDLDNPNPMRVEDFPRPYRWLMVRSYAAISGVPNPYAASRAEIDAGFRRVLNNRHLRQTHEMFLADLKGAFR